jgi:hypothetical protein
MDRTRWLLVGLGIIAAVMVCGCLVTFIIFNLFGKPATDFPAVETQSAQLIEEGRLTQTAENPTVIIRQTELPAIATETQSLPTIRPTETATPIPPTATLLLPSSTPLPSFTPLPSLTPIPTITPLPCDRAEFVKDVTVPDGTLLAPGSVFTKTWRLRNSGTCTWSSSYTLVFDRGERMGGASPTNLGGNVAPGSTVDVSVTLTAPPSEGKYRGYWRLANPSGVTFGVGANNSSFYVDIVSQSATTSYAFDFAANYCTAEWTSGYGSLPCPGPTGDSKGYVQRLENAVLETGYIDDEPALLTVPQAQTDGVIRGKFNTYNVQNGDTFQAILFCAKDAKDCSVKFQLDYVVSGDSTIYTAGSWVKTWDGSNLIHVTQDLSGLAGKSVRFILTVFANGEMKNDRAEWLAPRITHK